MQAQVQGFRLSPQQVRLWLLQQSGAPGWVQGAVDLTVASDPVELRRGLQAIVDRHDSLRTRFRRAPGIKLPVQIVAGEEVTLRQEDLGAFDDAALPAQVQRAAESERSEPFDPERGPVLRALLLRLGEKRHRLLLTAPAICLDEWSLRNLVSELAGELAGRCVDPDEVVQYVQFSEWQNELLSEEGAEEGRDFWRSRGGAPFAPFALPFETAAEEAAFHPATLEAALSPALAGGVEALAGDCATEAGMVLLAGWLALLQRTTGAPDLTLGLGCDGRRFEDLHGTLGLFARWLPLHVRMEAETPFRELVARTVRAVTAAESHQDFFLPGVEQKPVEVMRFSFGFERVELPAGQNAEPLELSLSDLDGWTEPFRARLTALRRGGDWSLRLSWDPARSAASYVRALLDQLLALLENAAAQPGAALEDLDLLGEGERRQLIRAFNDTAAPFPREICLHEWFSEQAARDRDATAVIFQDRRLTFGELDDQANRVARYLRRLGAGPDVLIPVLLDTSPEMIVALLGILKAGAAYVPLDPRHPRERLERILRDARPPFVVTEARFAGSFGELRTVLLDAQAAEIEAAAAESPADPPLLPSPDNLCYVLYTSGSTGSPKGVMVEHRGVVNYLAWCISAYRVSDGSGAPVHSPLAFDLTVTSLFAPLLAGRAAVLVPEEQGVEGLGAVLRGRQGFSLVKITPSHLEALGHLLRSEDAGGMAGTLVIGGEALLAEQLAFWKANAPAVRVVNEYGPTETVVGCCVHEAPAGELGSGPVPIGRPIANMALYALDPGMRPVPVGAPGEVYIGGVGLARGYLGRPDATAERFVPDPFSAAPGARLYRTGDLARFRPDRLLEYLGRNDGQVKIRGYRVELGEVESALRSHPAVREAVAVLREDVPGDPRLVGYFTSESPAVPDLDELRAFLAGRLPDPMVPGALARLEALPLTPNGKVDRRALPVPEARRAAVYAAPQSEAERKIAAMWQDVLHVERVGLDDNFFELGGHSLLMVQVFGRLRQEIDPAITMVELFEYPTVRAMGGFLSGGRKAEVHLEEAQDRADERREALLLRERRQRPVWTDA
jgi:amino acid adenylation domain-containing protein